MQIRGVISIFVIAGFFFLVLKVNPSLTLSCLNCASRDHIGCISLNHSVFIQKCVEGEVCGKSTSYKKFPDGTDKVIGVIRHCVKLPGLGSTNNQCFLQTSNKGHPSEMCRCNDTDLCNGTEGFIYLSLTGNGKVIAICFILLVIFHIMMDVD